VNAAAGFNVRCKLRELKVVFLSSFS
jgi:hypothetical protein